MSNLRQLRTRIKTSKSTAKVTKAMEMVAASKMKRAQDQSKSATLYTDGITEIVAGLKGAISKEENIFFRINKVKKVCIVVYGPSRGFCGALNTNLSYSLRKFIKSLESLNIEVSLITVMKMAHKIGLKMGNKILAHFSEFEEYPKVQSIYNILEIVKSGFIKEEFDEVYIAYPKFINTAIQTPEIIKVLPVDTSIFNNTEEKKASTYFELEPSKSEILDRLIPEYIEMRFFNALLSTKASEHSARMLVMRNATDNAKEMIDELTLKFNKTRQAQITTEIIETSGRI